MNTLALIFGGVALYLYLEIWTIRICLRYGGWLLAWVLLIDHVLMAVNFTLFPIFLFWKVWFLWTANRAEPLRGMLWVPQLAPEERRRSGRGLLVRRLLLTTVCVLGALFFLSGLMTGDPEAIGGLFLLALILPPVILFLRWVSSVLWRVFGPQKRIPEPMPWDRGPVSW